MTCLDVLHASPLRCGRPAYTRTPRLRWPAGSTFVRRARGRAPPCAGSASDGRLRRLACAPMELVQLGRSDLRVSRVGLGCNNFGGRIDLDATRAVVDAALDAGVTLLRHRRALRRRRQRALPRRDPRRAPRAGGDRDEVRLGRATSATGVRRRVRAAIRGSLERLRTDYVDLYYLHKADPSTPIARHARARWTSSSRPARCGRSAARTSRPSSSQRPIGSRRSSGRPGSRRCRTGTASSNVGTTRTSCRSAASSGSRTCRTSRSRAAS